MRLFRRKKKETPRKAKPASIYYSPAAEEPAVPRTPQEKALADFAAETPLQTPPTLRTPVQIPSSRNGDLDGADLRDTLARATIDPEAKRRLEALLDRLEAAERAAVQTPVRRQVSWDPETVERPPVVRDESWRSLRRGALNTNNTLKASIASLRPRRRRKLADGAPAAARLPRRRGRGRGRVRLRRRGAGAVARVAAPRRAAQAARARRAACQGYRGRNSSGMSDEETAARAGRLCGEADNR